MHKNIGHCGRIVRGNLRFAALCVICLLILSLELAAAEKNAGVSRPRNIILIGWDGAERSLVKEMLAEGKLPNLGRLAASGRIVAIDVLRITDTTAGWPQILTGYEPETTGVFGNHRYQPIPGGYTVFERLKEFFGPDEFAAAILSGKIRDFGANPPLKIPADAAVPDTYARDETATVRENGVEYRILPGQPYYHTRNALDVFANGLGDADKVGAEALKLLEKYADRPFFFFILFSDTDYQGHLYGEDSPEYRNALVAEDAWLGRIAAELQKLRIYRHTLIYVTADHGFDAGRKTHYDAPYVFLATNDPKVMRRGTRLDIAPTILDRFGLNWKTIRPPLDGHPLTRPYTPPLF